MSVTFLDPMGKAVSAEVSLCERAANVDAYRRILLLENGKPNSDRILQYVGEALQRQFPGITWEMRRKPSSFKPAPEAVLQQATEFGAVITGVGD